MPDGIDPAFAAVAADPRLTLRPPPPGLPLAVLRRAADAYLAAAPRPRIHHSADDAVPGPAGAVPVRLYRPSAQAALPVVVFAHGGGFVFGTLDTHDALCRTLATASGAAVLAVGYRLAPEAPAPAALDDIAAVLAALPARAGDWRIDPARVAIAGDSAGGHLAAATALARRVAHVALLYPMVAPAGDTASFADHADGPLVSAAFLRWAWGVSGYGAIPTNALAAYPPTTIVTASHDPLRDEGEAFGAALRVAGRDVVVERIAGTVHGFAGLPFTTPHAARAVATLADRLRLSLARTPGGAVR